MLIMLCRRALVCTVRLQCRFARVRCVLRKPVPGCGTYILTLCRLKNFPLILAGLSNGTELHRPSGESALLYFPRNLGGLACLRAYPRHVCLEESGCLGPSEGHSMESRSLRLMRNIALDLVLSARRAHGSHLSSRATRTALPGKLCSRYPATRTFQSFLYRLSALDFFKLDWLIGGVNALQCLATSRRICQIILRRAAVTYLHLIVLFSEVNVQILLPFRHSCETPSPPPGA